MSTQAKKILLILLKSKEQHKALKDLDLHREYRGMTLKDIVRKIEGEAAFYGKEKYLSSNKGVSYGRTLRRLVDEGYLDRKVARFGQFEYLLSEKGVEKADELRTNIQRYVEEWTPLVPHI